jgi:hypothetical protein
MINYKETGFELRNSESKGEGVFATKSFKINDIVMVGTIEKVLDDNHSHASQIDEDKYVLHSGLISKVNHSCDPNCGIKVNKNGAHDYIAIRNIGLNEEITFDYAMRNYNIEYFPEQCMCGSDKCRKIITGWKGLFDNKKNEYKEFVAPYLIELDKK